MAKAKQRRSAFDDAAQEYLSGEKPKRDRSWDKKRSRMTYDLPPALIARVAEIAAEIGAVGGGEVTVSEVARLLIEAGVGLYDSGSLKPTTHPAKLKLYDD